MIINCPPAKSSPTPAISVEITATQSLMFSLSDTYRRAGYPASTTPVRRKGLGIVDEADHNNKPISG